MCKCDPTDPRPFCGKKETRCFPVAKNVTTREVPPSPLGGDTLSAKRKEKGDTDLLEMERENEAQAPYLGGTRLKNPRWERFCQLWASDREFFGNGTQSYIEAFSIDITKPGAYNVARESASRLLAKPDVNARINEIIDATGLSEPYADKQLYVSMTQNVDFKAKVAAVSEYNKLKGRITEKSKVTHTFSPTNVSAEIIRKAQGRREAA